MSRAGNVNAAKRRTMLPPPDPTRTGNSPGSYTPERGYRPAAGYKDAPGGTSNEQNRWHRAYRRRGGKRVTVWSNSDSSTV